MSLHEGKDAKAAAKGLVIATPSPGELFLDLDDEAAHLVFWQQLPIVADLFGVYANELDFRHGPSPSGKPWHTHVVVRLPRDEVVDNDQRIALQACLGSDRLHEILSYRENFLDLADGYPSVLFARPGFEDDPTSPLSDLAWPEERVLVVEASP